MSDWHSLLYCKPLFGFDDAIQKWNNNPVKMEWEYGHFSSPEENIEYITSLHPEIVFEGLVHEYSDGSDDFWNIIFSKEDGIIYEGKHYNEDFSCSPNKVIIDDLRISNIVEINRENLWERRGLLEYDKPVTNKELIEFLKTQPQNELSWINGSGNRIYIGHDEIYDSIDGKTEYEFLYDDDFKNYKSPFSGNGDKEAPF